MSDSLDERIIAALREDARLSSTALARRLGVSRATVHNRMARLEREGVITGYTVTLGEAYRAGQVAAHVLVEVEQRLTAQVTGQLGRISEVQALYAISGDYDLIVVLSAPSTGALSQLLDRISELRGVLRTKSSVILETKLQR
jgi:DNA-binding Lrp family transcriptional regulator